jgi:hypothetical protein
MRIFLIPQITFAGHTIKGLEDVTVAMQVMDHDRFSHDDAIGDVFVPMRGVPVNTNPAYWKRVQRHTHPKVTVCHLSV